MPFYDTFGHSYAFRTQDREGRTPDRNGRFFHLLLVQVLCGLGKLCHGPYSTSDRAQGRRLLQGQFDSVTAGPYSPRHTGRGPNDSRISVVYQSAQALPEFLITYSIAPPTAVDVSPSSALWCKPLPARVFGNPQTHSSTPASLPSHEQWSCTMCTLVNVAGSTKCEVCGGLHPNYQPSHSNNMPSVHSNHLLNAPLLLNLPSLHDKTIDIVKYTPWIGKRVVVFKGKYKGRGATVMALCKSKLKLRVDGVQHEIHHYPDQIQLVDL